MSALLDSYIDLTGRHVALLRASSMALSIRMGVLVVAFLMLAVWSTAGLTVWAVMDQGWGLWAGLMVVATAVNLFNLVTTIPTVVGQVRERDRLMQVAIGVEKY